jgi:hypothetical protein
VKRVRIDGRAADNVVAKPSGPLATRQVSQPLTRLDELLGVDVEPPVWITGPNMPDSVGAGDRSARTKVRTKSRS